MKRIWLSFSSSLGVVPDEISAWNPDSAPHAMVMNRKGNREPGNTGPSPVVAKREMAGAAMTGWAKQMPIASKAMAPTFMNVDR